MNSTQTNNDLSYGYQCENCAGIVRSKLVEREAFKHRKGFINLEEVIIGVCDVCGTRYYSAEILHAVHELASGSKRIERLEQVPVAHLAQ